MNQFAEDYKQMIDERLQCKSLEDKYRIKMEWDDKPIFLQPLFNEAYDKERVDKIRKEGSRLLRELMETNPEFFTGYKPDVDNDIVNDIFLCKVRDKRLEIMKRFTRNVLDE